MLTAGWLVYSWLLEMIDHTTGWYRICCCAVFLLLVYGRRREDNDVGLTSIMFGKIDSRLFCNVDFQFLRRDDHQSLLSRFGCISELVSFSSCLLLNVVGNICPREFVESQLDALRQQFSWYFSEKKQNN